MPAKRKASKAASTSPTNVSTEGENASAYTDVMLTNNISRSSSVAPSTDNKPVRISMYIGLQLLRLYTLAIATPLCCMFVWPQDDALVDPAASQEDLEEQMAPDSAVKEEHRLRAQREAAEAQEV